MSAEEAAPTPPNNDDKGKKPLTDEQRAKKNKKKKEKNKAKKQAAKAAVSTGQSPAANGAPANKPPSASPKNNNANNNNNNNNMDNSIKSNAGKNNKNNKNKNGGNNNNNNNNNINKAAEDLAKELAQSKEVIAGMLLKGQGLQEENASLKAQLKTELEKEPVLSSAGASSSSSDGSAAQVKALQAELAKAKASFAQDKVQLEENLKKAHAAQMDQATANLKTVQKELDDFHAAGAAAGGKGVADVWQTKCVATAKQLKDEKKYVQVLENEKNVLEERMDKMVKTKKAWWQCG